MASIVDWHKLKPFDPDGHAIILFLVKIEPRQNNSCIWIMLLLVWHHSVEMFFYFHRIKTLRMCLVNGLSQACVTQPQGQSPRVKLPKGV